MMRGGLLTVDPLRTEILVEDSRGVLRGQVGQDDIYEGAHFYGFRVVPGRFLDNLCEICVRYGLDCRTAGVLSISQFMSPNSTNSEDKWGAIHSHMVSRAHLGAEGRL